MKKYCTNAWFYKNHAEIKATFDISSAIPETLHAYSQFICFYNSKEEFNDPSNWEGTPWEDSKDVYAEMVARLPGCVAEIDGIFMFVDFQVYNMYLSEILVNPNY